VQKAFTASRLFCAQAASPFWGLTLRALFAILAGLFVLFAF
jgi:hypothetical protein